MKALLMERDMEVLEFCKKAPSWTDIKRTLKIPSASLHKSMKRLRRLGLIEKYKGVYITTVLGEWILSKWKKNKGRI